MRWTLTRGETHCCDKFLLEISSSVPQLCKWNAFAIDTWGALCKDEKLTRENFCHLPERLVELMSGRIVVPPLSEEQNRAVLPMGFVSGLLDKVEKALIVAE